MEENKTYTSFLPLVIFLTGTIVFNGYQVSQMYNQRQALLKQLDIANTPVQTSHEVEDKLSALVKDLLQVSATDTNAAAIVKQFNIQEHKPDSK